MTLFRLMNEEHCTKSDKIKLFTLIKNPLLFCLFPGHMPILYAGLVGNIARFMYISHVSWLRNGESMLSLFTKTFVLGTQKNCLSETVLLSSQNI